MRKILCFVFLLAGILMTACKPSSDLNRLAMSRLDSVVSRDLAEKENLEGTIKLTDVKTVFDSDSLCIVQCLAVCKDSLGTETALPLRYILVHDFFMSIAKGHTVYSEGLFGANLLSDDEVKGIHKEIAEGGPRSYEYYVGVTLPIEDIQQDR